MAERVQPEPAWLIVDHPDGLREHVRLTLALTTIGRSEQNVLELLDAKLSRFHCEIERRGAAYFIRDCNSRNGTRVNDQPLGAIRRLEDQDCVQVGQTKLNFLARRPDELARTDRVRALDSSWGGVAPVDEDEDETALHTTPPVAQRRPSRKGDTLPSADAVMTARFDPRNTAALDVAAGGDNADPWHQLARASAQVLDAATRAQVLERAVAGARSLLQASGAMIAHGRQAGDLTITASMGVEEESRAACLTLAERVIATQGPVTQGRKGAGVPLISRERVQGALVLHDLAAEFPSTAPELKALRCLADVTARSLTGSLLIEEVRREERGAGVRRIGHDLRQWLRPSLDGDAEGSQAVAGLEVGLAQLTGPEVGCDFWDRLVAPPRAGREEVYLAVGNVPDVNAPPPERLRRQGERSLVSLLGQAELRGALRSLIEVLPRTSDVIGQLNRALRQGVSVDRLSLLLARYDPGSSQLRFSGAGHEPLLLRRAGGRVEPFAALGPALGLQVDLSVSERTVRWERGDEVLLASTTGLQQEPDLAALFAKHGGPGREPREVAEAIAQALVGRVQAGEAEGLTLMLLRRT
jgi:pSer/pThr/pTyr-binding forkhead associated (FHA) protein